MDSLLLLLAGLVVRLLLLLLSMLNNQEEHLLHTLTQTHEMPDGRLSSCLRDSVGLFAGLVGVLATVA